jgi:transcriptional regulator GlxA family with amidase domain
LSGLAWRTAFATWEDLDTFREQFPSFQLEDELLLEEGRDVMCGWTYARRRRARDIRRAAERAAARDAARAAITADDDGRAESSG